MIKTLNAPGLQNCEIIHFIVELINSYFLDITQAFDRVWNE